MKCEICKRGPQDGITVFRANETGVTPIWRCADHPSAESLVHQNDPEINAIEAAINPKGQRTYMRDGNFITEPWPDSGNYSDPTEQMLRDGMWNAIWEEIKHWDINVPSQYAGYMGATGNHVTAIYKAVMATVPTVPPAAPDCGASSEPDAARKS